MGKITSYRQTYERYTALRFIGVIFTGLGAILLTIGGALLAFVLHALLSFWMEWPVQRVFPGGLPVGLWGVWSLALVIGGLQFLAIGTLIRLIIDLEENTRVSAQCLEQLRSREDPTERNVGSFFRS
ncbi:MAG: hypothetical protein ACP5XB_22190 [Isosphaeraceae bacterium]